MVQFAQRAMLPITFIVALLLCGCPSGKPVAPSSGDVETTAKPPVESAEGGVKVRPVSELTVKTGDYLPPLDDGRIEIARPNDWEVGSRQVGYVAWFHRYKETKTLPHIRITVEPAPPEAPQDVTKENVEEFAKWLSANVKSKLKKDEQLIEPVIPMIVGDNAVGRYVRQGRYREADAEQHLLVTIQGGRMYTVQQLVIRGDLEKKDVRDAAYATVAALKFNAAGASLTPEATFQPPTETSPATAP